ncbi:MAG: hypothetical protein LBC74_08425 [Planctomycetaceae bacterium]|jgi:hypothetical protein|nr:hypothetical protein [Planctomycetaceae bacterium]
MRNYFIVFIFSQIFCFTFCKLFAAENVNYNDTATVEKCLKIIADDNEYFSRKHPSTSMNIFYHSVELLGSIRDNRPEVINALVVRLDEPIWARDYPGTMTFLYQHL